jgi:hypothetical protein
MTNMQCNRKKGETKRKRSRRRKEGRGGHRRVRGCNMKTVNTIERSKETAIIIIGWVLCP